jgi:ABC-type phosphate/phosphonate transport system substrate-binding protein
MDRCNAGIVAVAVGKDGKPFYRSVVLTADPSVRRLPDLKGKKFGLFKGSTASHILPLKMLHSAGLQDADIIPVYYDSQDHILNALLDRSIAGAGVKESLYQKFRNEALRVLRTSEPLPGFALATSPSARPAATKALQDAILRLDPLKQPQDRQLMQEWDDEIKNGFVRPPSAFRADVMNVLSVYREILHED